MSNTDPSNTLPPPSLDVEMTDTSPTAGQERVGNTEEPLHADNGGTDENEQIEPYTPDERQREIVRILRWTDNAYYEILDVRTNADERTIRKAWLKRSSLAHPDQNNDRDATEVMQSK